MKWSKQNVRRDEEVTLSCSFTNGVEEGDEVKVIIYEHDNDGYHDKVVTVPTIVKNNKVELKWEFIYQEDTDDIPTQEELQKYGKSYKPPEYFFVVIVDNVPVGKKQESGLLLFKDWIEIELKTGKGEPVQEQYTLILPDGTTRKGKLDKNGKAVEKDIPPGKCSIEFGKLDENSVMISSENES